MVVFQCEGCGETVKKPKADAHSRSCRKFRGYVCIDCMTVFSGDSYRAHTACITEAEKYQGKLYRPPKSKTPKQQPQPQPVAPTQPPAAAKRPAVEEEKEKQPEKAEQKPPAKKAKKGGKRMEEMERVMKGQAEAIKKKHPEKTAEQVKEIVMRRATRALDAAMQQD